MVIMLDMLSRSLLMTPENRTGPVTPLGKTGIILNVNSAVLQTCQLSQQYNVVRSHKAPLVNVGLP